jgi:outer membrane protein assembly factor BamB
MKRAAATTLLFSCGIVQPLAAADWPQWRGPLGTGVTPEAGLPQRWTPDSVAWTARLAGAGVSSPVVSGERVFVTSQQGVAPRKPGSHPTLARGEEASAERPLGGSSGESGVVFVVEAFDRSDGRRLWEYRLPAEGGLPELHEKHNLASPSAVTDGEAVFAWFGNGQLVALGADGKRLWQRHLGREIGPFEINWGHGSSPALHKGLLYLLCYHEPKSTLLALDAKTGETRWQVERGKDIRSYSTPVVVPGPKGEELIVNSTDRIDAYDPATGAPLWHAGAPHRFAVPVPSFHDGVIYTSRGYRSGPYMAIRAGGRGDVNHTHVKWLVGAGAPYISSLLYYDGLVYMASDAGIVTAIDPSSGERAWQERVGGIFSASPVAGDGKVYFMSETGETIVVKAGREPKILERSRIDGRVVASPAISGGRLFIRSDDRLIAVGGTPTR